MGDISAKFSYSEFEKSDTATRLGINNTIKDGFIKENIKALVERNGIAKPLYIGDTQGDCDEAHRAGVPFAFAAYGFGSCSNPDLSFDSFNTIVDYFMNIKEK